MDKTGNIKAGVSPCTFCGVESQLVTEHGNAVCKECHNITKVKTASTKPVKTTATETTDELTNTQLGD